MSETEPDTTGRISGIAAAPAVTSSLLEPGRMPNSGRAAFRLPSDGCQGSNVVTGSGRWIVGSVVLLVCCPFILLVLLSIGSGWAFPNILPDRLNGAPWRTTFGTGSSLARAAGTSVILSVLTSLISTSCGFLLARRLRYQSGWLVHYLLYVPFVVSPVVAGVCVYDLAIRLQLAGSFSGVLLIQSLFATCFSTIYFREAAGHRLERIESLIRMLGGDSIAVWRDGIWPQCRGLIVICLIQTALYSWLDYGLVSVIGGGNVVPLTVRLFGYIREASTNQASLASLILMVPAIAGLLLIIGGEIAGKRAGRKQHASSYMPGGAE